MRDCQERVLDLRNIDDGPAATLKPYVFRARPVASPSLMPVRAGSAERPIEAGERVGGSVGSLDDPTFLIDHHEQRRHPPAFAPTTAAC